MNLPLDWWAGPGWRFQSLAILLKTSWQIQSEKEYSSSAIPEKTRRFRII
jgi:hypothetical protein